MQNLPKHHDEGPQEVRGPMQLHWLHRLQAGLEHTEQSGNTSIDDWWSLNRSRILKIKKFSDPVSSEISNLCEISDLLLFFSYFASQNKEIKSGNYFFYVCCEN